jgi:hypothetical protein
VARSLGERLDALPIARLLWRHAARVIPAAFGTIAAYEDAVDPADLELLLALEAPDEAARLALIPSADRIVGAGAGYVMPSFTHPPPDGSRFVPPRAFGAYYAARDAATAVAETVYHRERTFRETHVPAGDFDQRLLVARIRATNARDLRGHGSLFADVLDPGSYGAGQAAGVALRDAAVDAVAYDSVRRPGGACMVVFRPRCVSGCRARGLLTYRWDGSRVTDVFGLQRVG